MPDAAPDPPTQAADPGGGWGPPGLVFWTATTVVLALGVWYGSGSAFLESMLVALAALALLLAWAWRALWALLGRPRPSARGVVRWLAVPLAVGLAVAAVASGAASEARFELGRPAMEGAAARVAAGGPTDAGWIGLWPAEAVERTPGGMRFLVSGCGFIDRCGFAYSTAGPVEGVMQDGESATDFERIDAHWFLWIWRF